MSRTPEAARCSAAWPRTDTSSPRSMPSFRMALTECPGVIVPRKAVNELRMLLEADDQEIAVSVSESKVRFAAPGITLTSKVVEGTFPDYTRVIPAENDKRLEVDAKEFAKAVDRVATVSSETSRVVKLSLSEDQFATVGQFAGNRNGR